MPSASTVHKTQRVHESRQKRILLYFVRATHNILNTRHENMSFMAQDCAVLKPCVHSTRSPGKLDTTRNGVTNSSNTPYTDTKTSVTKHSIYRDGPCFAFLKPFSCCAFGVLETGSGCGSAETLNVRSGTINMLWYFTTHINRYTIIFKSSWENMMGGAVPLTEEYGCWGKTKKTVRLLKTEFIIVAYVIVLYVENNFLARMNRVWCLDLTPNLSTYLLLCI